MWMIALSAPVSLTSNKMQMGIPWCLLGPQIAFLAQQDPNWHPLCLLQNQFPLQQSADSPFEICFSSDHPVKWTITFYSIISTQKETKVFCQL